MHACNVRLLHDFVFTYSSCQDKSFIIFMYAYWLWPTMNVYWPWPWISNIRPTGQCFVTTFILFISFIVVTIQIFTKFSCTSRPVSVGYWINMINIKSHHAQKMASTLIKLWKFFFIFFLFLMCYLHVGMYHCYDWLVLFKLIMHIYSMICQDVLLF